MNTKRKDLFNLSHSFLFSALVVTSCQKHPPKTFTIKGKPLMNCNGAVVSNTKLQIISKSQIFTQGFTAYSKTDKDENFSISYERNCGEYKVYTKKRRS